MFTQFLRSLFNQDSAETASPRFDLPAVLNKASLDSDFLCNIFADNRKEKAY